ncbi:hypothetical protein ABIA35_008914 [Catenulispora sp. MAP12-49]|uniref:hypothetical protein n=1 Tax=unclassified Catenulispora TaxID=414885 RepID=UPI00351352C0
MASASEDLSRLADELAAPTGPEHEDQIAEQTVFLAARIATAASNALHARYPCHPASSG